VVPEPGSGEFPVALDGAGRDAEGFGDFIFCHIAKIPIDDHAGHARVDFFERCERVIEIEQIGGLLIVDRDPIVQCDGLIVAGSLGGTAAASVIDENLSHRAGGHSEEMGAVLPVSAVAHELQVDLIYKRGRLESMTRILTPEVPPGYGVQVRIDTLHKILLGYFIAGRGAAKQLRHRRVNHGPNIIEYFRRIN
jgi:hypothetical protein